MRLTKTIALLLALFITLAMLPACEEEEEDEPSAAEWIARGKTLLGEGDGTGAYLAFQSALELESNNLQARYGVVLADVLQFTGTINLLFGLFDTDQGEGLTAEQTSGLCRRLDECGVLDWSDASYADCVATTDYGLDIETATCVIGAPSCDTMLDRCMSLTFPASKDLCEAACAHMTECGLLDDTTIGQSECAQLCPTLYVSGELQCLLLLDDCSGAMDACFPVYGDSIQKLLSEFWEKVSLEMGNQLNAIQTSETPFSFPIEKFNFTFLDLIFHPSLAGTHDLTDTYFFSSIYSGMDSLFSGVQVLNMNFNPVLLNVLNLDAILNLDFSDLNEEDLNAILALLDSLDEIIALVLDDPIYTDFLTLNDPEDVESVRKVGVQIGWIFGNLAVMIERLQDETDDQTDNPIRYVDENGDGRWNAPEPMIIPGVIEAEYDLAWAIHDILLALKVDFVDGYPFHFESLTPLFDYFDVSFVNLIIEALDLFGVDSVDLGGVFRNPDPQGLRGALSDIQEFIELLQTEAQDETN